MKPIIVTYSNESYWWTFSGNPEDLVYILTQLSTGIASIVIPSDIKLIARPKK